MSIVTETQNDTQGLSISNRADLLAKIETEKLQAPSTLKRRLGQQSLKIDDAGSFEEAFQEFLGLLKEFADDNEGIELESLQDVARESFELWVGDDAKCSFDRLWEGKPLELSDVCHHDLKIDVEAATTFLNILHQRDYHSFMLLDDDKARNLPALKLKGSIAKHIDKFLEYQSLGYGVFNLVNESDGKGYEVKNILYPRALFADFDGTEPSPEKLAQLPQPSIIVRSAHGKHYYWLLEEKQSRDLFKPAQQRIAEFLGSDPTVCNLNRQMRIPGTFNMKDSSSPFPVALEYINADVKYKILDVIKNIETGESQKRERLPSKPTLDDLTRFVLSSRKGSRNADLNKASYQTVALMSKGTPREHIEAALLQAALTVGLEESEALKTIKSGLDASEARVGESTKTKYQSAIESVGTLLGNDLKFNVRSGKHEYKGKAVNLQKLWIDIESEYGLNCSLALFETIASTIAEDNEYDPVKKYLDSLEPRNSSTLLDTFVSQYLGNHDLLAAHMFKKTLIAAVARVYEPGVKHDVATVLVGKQGYLKTTLWETLASPEFFVCPDSDVKNGADEIMLFRKGWIVEWGEIEVAFGKKSVSSIKNFLSIREDRFRKPYGKEPEDFPRNFLIVGSTNQDNFLNDPTGSRRFWIIEVLKKIDIAAVEKIRDLLWAEAIYLYNQGEQHWLEAELETEREEANKAYSSQDPWQETVEMALDFLLEKSKETDEVLYGFTTNSFLELLFGIPIDKVDKRIEMRFSDIMKGLGWRSERESHGKGRVRAWRPGDYTLSTLQPTTDIKLSLQQHINSQKFIQPQFNS